MTRLHSLASLLGRAARGRFILTYVVVAGCAMGAVSVGELANRKILLWSGGVLAAVATIVLVAVTAWYRRENMVNAAILLAVAWTFARLAALGIAALILWMMGHGAWLGFGAMGGLFGLPVAILEWILVSGVLVTLLRRIRAPVVSKAKGDGGGTGS
ncbi:MAG: hypothetical protein ACREOJ_18490 [Gemmatimonadaceae bacterium]